MEDRERVAKRFFKDGVLFCMPSKLAKRRIVLEWIAMKMDCSREFTEKEINEILIKIYDDYCTLRRYLVDEGLLKREKGIYRFLKVE